MQAALAENAHAHACVLHALICAWSNVLSYETKHACVRCVRALRALRACVPEAGLSHDSRVRAHVLGADALHKARPRRDRCQHVPELRL